MAETKSSTHDTPCQVLLRWLRSLPNRLCKQIAGHVVDGSPYMRNGSGGGSGRSIDALTSYLERCRQEPFEDAMGAASVAGMIDDQMHDLIRSGKR